MRARFLSCCAALVVFLLLLPRPVFAEPKNYMAQEGAVSSLLIFEQAGFARSYGIFTSGVARAAYDETSKTLDNLKFALLMSSFVSNNATLKQSLLARRAYNPDRENELAFLQSEPATFTDGKARIKGQIFLNGASRNIVFEATFNKLGQIADRSKDFFEDGAKTLGFSFHASLKRSDFHLGDTDGNTPLNDDFILMLDVIAQN